MSRSSARSRTQLAANEVLQAAKFLSELVSSSRSLGDVLGQQQAIRGLADALHAHERDPAVMRHLLLRSEVPRHICSSLALVLRHLSSAAGTVSPEEPAMAAAAHLASFVCLPLFATRHDSECALKLAIVVQDSGLLAAITTSAAVLTQLIQPTEQHAISCAAMLTGTLLMIWSVAVGPLCSTERGSRAIPSTAMLATARLVVAAVRAYPPSVESSRGNSAPWAPPTGSNSRRAVAAAAAAAAAAADPSGSAAYYYTRQLKAQFDEEHLHQTASLVMSNLVTEVLCGVTRSFSTALPSILGLGSAAGSAGDPSSIMWVADMGSDPAALADLGLVLYTHLAWMAQVMHGQQSRQAAAGAGGSRGRGRGSRQQQQQQGSSQLPVWHEDFLAAVHAPPRGALCDATPDPSNIMGHVILAVCRVGLYLDIANSFGDALGRGVRDVILPARLDGSASGIESNLPVRETLLLLLEVMLLVEEDCTHLNCYKRIASFLHRSQPGDAAATADALLQPVLQQLAPVVLGTPAPPASSSSAAAALGADTALSATADAKKEEFAMLVEFLVTTGSGEALLAAYKQQPGLTCKALELAVRIRHKAGNRVLVLPSRECLQTANFVTRVLQLCKAAPAAAAAGQQRRQLFALALSCLKHPSQDLPSRVKSDMTAARLKAAAAAVAVGAKLGNCAPATQRLGASAETSDTNNATDTASSSSSSSSGSAQASAAGVKGESGRMGLVLAAYGLLTAGQHMLSISEAGNAGGSDSNGRPAAAAATAAAASSDEESAWSSGAGDDNAAPASPGSSSSSTGQSHLAGMLQTHLKSFNSCVCWLGSVLPAVELPGGPGSQQACAAARQQLLQLQRRLQQDLQDAVNAVNSSSSNSPSNDAASANSSASDAIAPVTHHLPPAVPVALPGLAQQLAVFGEALCAQFPLPHCCNNPGCVELRGASELQLVGGKGSVCSRCRTARYCCRQCQLDHLKAHRPVCKRVAGQSG